MQNTRLSRLLLSISCILLYIYISNLANRFYARGYLDELLQVLKYNVFFSVAITFTWFMMEGFFSISRRGMIYFFLLNTLSRSRHGPYAQKV